MYVIYTSVQKFKYFDILLINIKYRIERQKN